MTVVEERGTSSRVVASERPKLRGVLHLATALATPFGLIVLLLVADGPRAYVGASIFALSLIALYTTSATYHLVRWPEALRGPMNRLDHSMIFVLIAGTYTPFCLVVLGMGWGITMLVLVWTLAGLGIALKIVWPRAPRWLSVALYLGLGWLAVIPSAEVTALLTTAETMLLMLGGAFYTLGAIVYAMRRPDPSPAVFGYHEVFHSLVIAGSVTHFLLIAIFVLPA